ncbi:hypothetical protein PV326_005010, partial [Microctonus aethiopoides]
ENIVRQRRDNVATSMDNEGRSGAAEKRNETGAKLCAGNLEEVAKATLWSKLSRRRLSGLSCRVEDRLVSIVAWITLYATPWSGVRDSSTSPSNGPVEEVRGDADYCRHHGKPSCRLITLTRPIE